MCSCSFQLFKHAEQAEESEVAIPVDGYSLSKYMHVPVTDYSHIIFVEILASTCIGAVLAISIVIVCSVSATYSTHITRYLLLFVDDPKFGEELDFPLFYITPIIEMSEKQFLQIYNFEISSGSNPRLVEYKLCIFTYLYYKMFGICWMNEMPQFSRDNT